MSSILDNLNAQQKKAALQTHGPQIIFAGAGSGKTRTLTHKIAYMCSIGIKPENILAITFTTKAASEMKKRIRDLIGSKSSSVTAKTFHSFCVQILREEHNSDFLIYDDKDQLKVVKKLLKTPDYEWFEEKEIIEYISKLKNNNIRDDQAALDSKDVDEATLALIYRDYNKILKENNALDFDDLLIYTLDILQEHTIRNKWSDRFKYIFVDEFQDTNKVQFELIKLLCRKYKNLCVVGDDFQAIYGWRGSNIDYIINFNQYFTTAKSYILETNYRSTPAIINSATKVMDANSYKVEKDIKAFRANKNNKIIVEQFTNEYFEADYIAEKIKEYEGRYSDIAILYRSNHQNRVLAEVLRENKIPYNIIKDPEPLSTVVHESNNRVQLLTAHGSKGLEFPIVFITGVSEELFPLSVISYADMEEERRLFYVAMTRAENQLYVTYPTSRTNFSSKRLYDRSHFIDLIPKEYIRRERVV